MQTDTSGRELCSRSECPSYDKTFPKYVKKLTNSFSQICQNLIKKITNRWRKDNQINFQVHFCLPGLPHPQPHQCHRQHQPPQHLLRGKVHRIWNKVECNLNLIPNCRNPQLFCKLLHKSKYCLKLYKPTTHLLIVVQIKLLSQIVVQINQILVSNCTNPQPFCILL